MTQSARIIDLARQRVRPAEISQRIGCPVYSVYTALKKARAQGHDIPPFEGGSRGRTTIGQELRFLLPPDVAASLNAEAKARGIPPRKLAAAIITAVCDDRLFDAVLEENDT